MTFQMSDITAVVCNWMQTRFTLGAVKNIRKYYPEMEIVVVDDGSEENKYRAFNTAYARPAYSASERLDNSPLVGDFKIVKIGNHMGHGSALDYGVDAVKTSLMLTMDNDVRILEDGIVEEYLAEMNKDPDNTYAVGTTFMERTCINNEHWPGQWIDPWFSLYQLAPIRQLHLTFSAFTFSCPGHSSFHLGTGGFLHTMLTNPDLHLGKRWNVVHYPDIDHMKRLWHLKKFPEDKPGELRYDMWKEHIDG